MCRKIGECNRLNAFRNDGVRRSITLQRIIEADGVVCNEFRENVAGKDLCKRTEPQHRVLRGCLMRAGCGFAVSTEEDLAIADDHKNHTGRAGTKKNICSERAGGSNVWRWWLTGQLRRC